MLSGLVAILRAKNEVDILKTSDALAAGGIRQIEITLNTPGALDGIQLVRERFGDDIVVGAGTVLSTDDALNALDSGAQFLVTPVLLPEVVSYAVSKETPICCGAMTPTEIYTAHQCGADYVKLFPAGSLGLSYIKTILGPLPFIKFVPTGGVTLENVGEFLQVCPAVGVGSNLVDTKLMLDKDWRGLTRLANQFVAAAKTR